MKKKIITALFIVGIISFILLPTFHPVLADDTSWFQDLLKEAKEIIVDLLEKLLSMLFLTIGAALYALLCLVVGEDFSLEKVIFNQYPRTLLSFFKGDPENPFLTEGSHSILDSLGEMFAFFRALAIITYMVILVYIGIRILLNSTAQKKAKYKELLVYWLEGVAILFLFPYVMKYTIRINDAFVAFIFANTEEMPMPVAESSGRRTCRLARAY